MGVILSDPLLSGSYSGVVRGGGRVTVAGGDRAMRRLVRAWITRSDTKYMKMGMGNGHASYH
jgi:hypothetical protein